MRLIVMYDLDISSSPEQVKEYTKFHKWLVVRGFIMMQYSVYMKPLSAPSKRDYEIEALKRKLPRNGNVRVLTITDKQYYDTVFLRGGKRINESINTEARRIKITHDEPIEL